MKNYSKLILGLLLFIGFLTSCTLKIDDEDNNFNTFIEITAPNQIIVGNTLPLDILIEDHDVIDKVYLEIPHINIDLEYNFNESDIEINEDFIVDASTTPETSYIKVRVKDNDGFYTTKTKQITFNN